MQFNANGTLITYAYDQQGRLIGRTCNDATYAFNESFDYHPLGGIEHEERLAAGRRTPWTAASTRAGW